MSGTDISWNAVEQITRGRLGRTMTICPACSECRRTPLKKRSKVLAVTLIEPDFAVYYCNHCEAKGFSYPEGRSRPFDQEEMQRRRDEAKRHAESEKQQRTREAMLLWNEAQPCRGGPVEKYLHYTRGIGNWLDTFPFLEQVFRYHPNCPFGGERQACMLALVRDIKTQLADRGTSNGPNEGRAPATHWSHVARSRRWRGHQTLA